MTGINIDVELGGGLELLFDGKKTFKVNVGEGSATESARNVVSLGQFISWIAEHLLVDKARKELFYVPADVKIKPGVLVLINDADWMLEGEGDYVLQDGDNISFISTLHGG